jgi:hypothetical protein
MRSKSGAGRPLSLTLGLCLVAACSAPALSPEEQRAREIETHCRAVADIERTNQASQGGEQIDEIDRDDAVWEQAPEGSEASARYQAAYAECMKKTQAE